MNNKQAGFALIAVMLFLILITVIGLIAVRQSRLNLKVATADQADTLLLNTSDSVLAHMEQAVAKPGSTEYKNITATGKGVLGYFMLHPTTKTDQQVVFCYTASRPATLFNLSNALIRLPSGGKQGSGGVCDPSQVISYSTARGVSLTQVVARGLTGDSVAGGEEAPLETLETGTSLGATAVNAPNPRIGLYSVSVLPALSSASSDAIKECLGLPVPPIKDSSNNSLYGVNKDMITCLKEQGIPATALVEEVIVRVERQNSLEAPICDPSLTGTARIECEAAGILSPITP